MNAIVLAALLECLSGNADCTIIESERTTLVTVCGVAPSAGDESHTWRFIYKGKPNYTARAQPVLDAVDAGELHLRGDYEDPEAMIQRIQQRASRINEIVGEQYLPKRDAILGGADHGD